ncbi:MAG: hypothetical protein H6908_01265 [Hyphomicrobiales bacterium]|nr:hypothetical protein [Hyphomicrobiales bacterium]
MANGETSKKITRPYTSGDNLNKKVISEIDHHNPYGIMMLVQTYETNQVLGESSIENSDMRLRRRYRTTGKMHNQKSSLPVVEIHVEAREPWQRYDLTRIVDAMTDFYRGSGQKTPVSLIIGGQTFVEFHSSDTPQQVPDVHNTGRLICRGMTLEQVAEALKLNILTTVTQSLPTRSR